MRALALSSLTSLVAVVATITGCQRGDQLASTQQEIVIVSPASHDFGSVQEGTASAAYMISVVPAAGANDDTISSITYSCPDFSISAPGLPAEVVRTCDPVGGCNNTNSNLVCQVAGCVTDDYETYSFTATFRPTVAAAVSCVVTINTASPRTVTLTGTGTPPPIHLDVEPGSVAFGDVRRNTDSGQAGISVGNTGGSTMTVSSVSVSAGFAIASGPTTGYTVGPSASQGYALVCHPTALGAMSGSFVVNSNDPTTPTRTIPLSCNGIDSNLDVSPSPAVLPNTRVGEPIQLSMMIGNSGNISTTLQSVAVTGDLTLMSGPAANTVLGASATMPVVVAYAATAAGSASGNLVITYDGGQTRTTQLTGRALATSLSLDPDGDLDFGPVCVGQTAMQTFTLVANSDGPFLLQQVTSSGDPFTVMTPTLPASLQGNAANNAQFMVAVAPTATGATTGNVTLTTDIPGATPHTVTVDVTGLPAGVTATPDAVDFGSNPIDITTVGQQVHLSNCLTTPITAANARIEGTDATEFTIVANPDAAGIASTQLASWLIVFSGHTTGLKTATFAVDYDGGTATIPLLAEVLGDTGSGGGGGTGDTKASYYACNGGGGPLGVLPLAVVMLFVWRRRRS